MVGYMIAARMHMAQDHPKEALQVLRPLRQMVEIAGWTLFVPKILILESLALHAQGNTPEALDHLAPALSLSEPAGCVQFFMEEGTPMVELLRHAVSRGIAPKYASELLERFETKQGVGPPPHLSTPVAKTQPLVEPLTQRELDVLRLLATRLSTAEIADRLFIAVSTVRSHTKNIYGKLSVHRRADAVERAKELKLI
jgi:LuxR family maltose regulon positive regulatory protein